MSHGHEQVRDVERRLAIGVAQPRAVGQREALRTDALRNEEGTLDLSPAEVLPAPAKDAPSPLVSISAKKLSLVLFMTATIAESGAERSM